MMSNFFAALDDSDDEGNRPQAVSKAGKKSSSSNKAPIAEASKQDRRRNERDGRGWRQPPREGKRAYERRSGTGRGREIKKGGGGSRNWGSDKNEARNAEGLNGEEGEVLEAVVEAGGEEEEEKQDEKQEEKQDEDEEAAARVRRMEEEAKKMTLDEYMAEKEARQKDSEAFRPLAEKELENEFAGFKPKQKLSGQDFLVMKGAKQPKKKGKQPKEKANIVPSFRVADSSASASARRDRRDNRGDRDRRSQGRPGRPDRTDRRATPQAPTPQPKPTPLDVADTNAFPSL